MENAVTVATPSLAELMNGQVAGSTQGTPSAMASLAVSSFIPSFGVCYATSDTFKKGIAKPGEFVLAGQTSLGDTVEVVVFDFRMHATHIKKDFSGFGDEIFHLSSDPRDMKDDTEYQAFLAKEPPSDCTLASGADLFLYIPAQTAFGLFFCKSTLLGFAEPMYQASRGGRILRLTTSLHEGKGKRSWYDIVIESTTRAIVGSPLSDVEASEPVPAELFEKYMGIFRNPSKGIKTDVTQQERAR